MSQNSNILVYFKVTWQWVIINEYTLWNIYDIFQNSNILLYSKSYLTLSKNQCVYIVEYCDIFQNSNILLYSESYLTLSKNQWVYRIRYITYKNAKLLIINIEKKFLHRIYLKFCADFKNHAYNYWKALLKHFQSTFDEKNMISYHKTV